MFETNSDSWVISSLSSLMSINLSLLKIWSNQSHEHLLHLQEQSGDPAATVQTAGLDSEEETTVQVRESNLTDPVEDIF